MDNRHKPKGRKEALADWVRDPAMKEDLVAAQVLLVLCVGLTDEEEKVKVICGWVRA